MTSPTNEILGQKILPNRIKFYESLGVLSITITPFQKDWKKKKHRI
jgi:hypothetical protein